jgi:hypothetical protein
LKNIHNLDWEIKYCAPAVTLYVFPMLLRFRVHDAFLN